MNTNTAVATTRNASLVERTAARFGVEPEKLMVTLKATAFKSQTPATNEQMMALLIVAEQHNLNPFTKEIYAYPDKGGGIVPVIGVDGWIRKVQEHPQFDGWEFDFDAKEGAMTCTIYRKDRSRPTRITEYIAECRRDTPPWKQSPRRMIRNRAAAQCARMAFGFAGVYDDDEAQGIVFDAPRGASNAQRVRDALKPQGDVIDMESTPPERSPLVQFLDDLQAITDADAAAELMDMARTLDADDYEILAAAYRGRFNPESEDNGE